MLAMVSVIVVLSLLGSWLTINATIKTPVKTSATPAADIGMISFNVVSADAASNAGQEQDQHKRP
jgi:hypothetical protein